MTRRVLLCLLGALVLMSCRDQDILGPGGEVRPDLVQAGTGGNPHFSFLDPINESPTNNGAFNPELSPVVEVCLRSDWDAAAEACGAGTALRTFTRDDSSGGKDRVRVDEEEEAYAAHWDTGEAPQPEPLSIYRIAVSIPAVPGSLGYADARFSEEKKPQPMEGVHTAKAGNVLPIRFRVEHGALSAALFGADEEFVCNDCAEETVAVSSTDTTAVTAPSGDASVELPPGAFEGVLPEGVSEVVMLVNEVTPTAAEPCLPTGLPQAGECYQFNVYYADPTSGEAVQFHDSLAASAVVGVCIEEALREQYELAKYSEAGPEEGLRILEPAATPKELDCTTIAFEGSRSPLARLAGRGLAGLGRAFLPALAYAGDTGYGGTTDAFSTVGWVETLEMQTVESTDSQTAVAGSTTPEEPAVRVLSAHELEHGDTVPVEGVEVTFTVASGGGVLGYSRLVEIKDTTDANGYASVAWRLGLSLGAQSLTAMIPDAPTSTGTDTLRAGFTATASEGVAAINVSSDPAAAPEPAVATFAEALSLVAADGTINVYPGTYPTQEVLINRPLTIQPAPGAQPVIRNEGLNAVGDTSSASFIIDGIESGTVTFRGLSFENPNRRSSISAYGRYDGIMVESSTFTVPGARGYGLFAGADSLSHVQVLNSTFTGGSLGVFAAGTRMDVSGSTFDNHTFSGIQYQGGSRGRIEGNTSTRCGLRGCIRVHNPMGVDVIGNTVEGTMDAARDTALFGIVAFSHDTIANGYSVFIQGNRVIGSSAKVDTTKYYGFENGIQVSNVARATVVGNRISETRNGIQFWRVVQGEIRNDTISPCGSWNCIGIGGGGDSIQVLDNVLESTISHRTFFGIIAGSPSPSGSIAIRNNQIRGVGTVGDLQDGSTYPLQIGVQVYNWNPGGTGTLQSAPAVDVSGNSIANAEVGVRAFHGGSVTGRYNRFEVIYGEVFGAHDYGYNGITHSNVTGYMWPFAQSPESVLANTCVYWGDAGPRNVHSWIPRSAYDPWATAPVTSTEPASCTSGYATINLVTPGSPSVGDGNPTVDNFPDALAWVAPLGTIQVHEGTHSARDLRVQSPITIAGDTLARPVIDAGGGNQSFFVQGMPSGTVTFRGLEFRNGTHQNIWVNGEYDRVVIEGSRFYPGSDPNAAQQNGFGYYSGVGIGDAVGNGLLVRNNAFTGGDIGVHSWNSTGVTIQGNSFSGQSNASVHLGGQNKGSYRVEGNRVSQCGTSWCMGIFEAGTVEVVSNSFDVDIAYPTREAINVWRTISALVQGNQIVGTGGTGDRLDENTFPIRGPAISVQTDQTGHSAVVTGNTVTNAFIGINWNSVDRGQVESNTLTRCGNACIGVWDRGVDLRIAGNVIRVPSGHRTQTGIGGTWRPEAGSLVIEGNDIAAVDAPADLTDYQSYPIEFGILVNNWQDGVATPPLGALATISRNRIQGASQGIGAHHGGNLTGTDNTVIQTHSAMTAHNGGRNAVHRSDITHYFSSLNVDANASADLTCNWWGSSEGPQNPTGTVTAEMYTPWANEPIANTTVACP